MCYPVLQLIIRGQSLAEQSRDSTVLAQTLHQLGIEPKRLDVPGRKRLDIDYGKPIRDILV